MPLVRIALLKGKAPGFGNLVEVRKENWSFGNGVAQYA